LTESISELLGPEIRCRVAVRPARMSPAVIVRITGAASLPLDRAIPLPESVPGRLAWTAV